RPCRYRREIQRDPGSADVADGTRCPGRCDRHTRCNALPKKHFQVAEEANMALVVQVKSNQPTLHQAIVEIATTAETLTALTILTTRRAAVTKAAPSPSSIPLANS